MRRLYYLTLAGLAAALASAVYLLWSLALGPALALCIACVRYLAGRAAPGDLDRAVGRPPAYSVQWTGPATARPYSLRFYTEEVRGRGDDRAPHDLVVRTPKGVARLARGDGWADGGRRTSLDALLAAKRRSQA